MRITESDGTQAHTSDVPRGNRNAEAAVKEWIEKFDITDTQQQERLVARPVK
jgi:hypothetical protein